MEKKLRHLLLQLCACFFAPMMAQAAGIAIIEIRNEVAHNQEELKIENSLNFFETPEFLQSSGIMVDYSFGELEGRMLQSLKFTILEDALTDSVSWELPRFGFETFVRGRSTHRYRSDWFYSLELTGWSDSRVGVYGFLTGEYFYIDAGEAGDAFLSDDDSAFGISITSDDPRSDKGSFSYANSIENGFMFGRPVLGLHAMRPYNSINLLVTPGSTAVGAVVLPSELTVSAARIADIERITAIPLPMSLALFVSGLMLLLSKRNLNVY